MQRALSALAAVATATALLSACASGPQSRPACPTAQQMEQPELLGRWSVTMTADSGGGVIPGPISMQLGPHPEWDGTVKGAITRPGYQSIVVGDVNKGELTMEESRDGKSVSGNWYGSVVEGSCAREIRGEWTDSDDRTAKFVMRKQP